MTMPEPGFTITLREVYDAVKSVDSKIDGVQLTLVNHEDRLTVVEKAVAKRSERTWQTYGIVIALLGSLGGSIIQLFHL